MSIIDRLRALFGRGPSNGDGSDHGPSGAGDSEMIACEDALRLVHDFLDGELEGVSEAQVRKHFEVCMRCYPHLQLETSYRAAVRRAAAGEGAPPALRAKVAELLAEAHSAD